MNAVPDILVGTLDRTVCVRVEVKGSFLNSTGLKEFAKEMTNRGFREFVVDLRNCPLMDSTFMGTLTGVALRLRELGQGGLRIVNLNERNRDLLINLGLDQLMTLDLDGALKNIKATAEKAVKTELPTDPADKHARAETMLEAHRDLVEANPANEAKFKDVLEYLRQDLQVAR
jgi:anti-anti-sigma regulatory factor